MLEPNSERPPRWTRWALLCAAIHNLVWGTLVTLAPLAIFRWAGLRSPAYPQIWPCVGMIVGAFGVGYGIASRNPYRHWPIVLVGLLSKVFGAIGLVYVSGGLLWNRGLIILLNDLIWCLPFVSILYLAFRHHTDTSQGVPDVTFAEAIRDLRSHRNASLWELSQAAPTLVVFLRHTGCTFCRENLAELARLRPRIDMRGTNLAIVHMGSPMDGTLMTQRRGLQTVHHFSDPYCQLYRAFGLERGTFRQLFSWRVIRRGTQALLKGHGIGPLVGDGFRMPGAFILHGGKIVVERRAPSADDVPDYLKMLSGLGGTCMRPTSTSKHVTTHVTETGRWTIAQ